MNRIAILQMQLFLQKKKKIIYFMRFMRVITRFVCKAILQKQKKHARLFRFSGWMPYNNRCYTIISPRVKSCPPSASSSAARRSVAIHSARKASPASFGLRRRNSALFTQTGTADFLQSRLSSGRASFRSASTRR